MTTLSNLLSQIQAAAGFFHLGSDSIRYPSDTLQTHTYQLYYRNSADYIESESVTIAVTNPGIASERAEFMYYPPWILQSHAQSAWYIAVHGKKAALLAGNSAIKRIVIKAFDETEKFAIATTYVLVTGKIVPTTYFLYDVAGTLTAQEYSGSMVN